jgi:hypothetical protein
MLLQSDPQGFLGLFEAYPLSLGAASFSKLRGRGAFLVSSSISTAGMVGSTTLVSQRGSKCMFRKPQSWKKADLKVVDGARKAVALDWESNGDVFFSFATDAATTYLLNFEPE